MLEQQLLSEETKLYKQHLATLIISIGIVNLSHPGCVMEKLQRNQHSPSQIDILCNFLCKIVLCIILPLIYDCTRTDMIIETIRALCLLQIVLNPRDTAF